MKRTTIFVMLFFSASPLLAQDGWSHAGAAIGGAHHSRQDAYNRGVIQGAQTAYLIESAKSARMQADILESQQKWRSLLASAWLAGGLDSDEAGAVASVYRVTNEQGAINIRVQHRGADGAVQDAWNAYRSYNYQLANQLLVGVQILLQNRDMGASQ